MNILVVEDDSSTRLVLEEVLSTLGFHPFAVPSCEAAERIMLRVSIDAAILDYLLENGTCEALANKLHEQKIPFIIITAARQAEDIAQRLRANILIKKPFDIDELDASLHETLITVSIRRSRAQ